MMIYKMGSQNMKYDTQFKPRALKKQEEIASYEDLRCLREAKMKEKDAPTIGIEKLKKKNFGAKRLAGGFSPLAPAPSIKPVRTRRLIKHRGLNAENL